MAIKTVWYRVRTKKDIQITGTEESRNRSTQYRQLTLDKEKKNQFQGGKKKRVFQQTKLEQLNFHMQKKKKSLDTDVTLVTKIKFCKDYCKEK